MYVSGIGFNITDRIVFRDAYQRLSKSDVEERVFQPGWQSYFLESNLNSLRETILGMAGLRWSNRTAQTQFDFASSISTASIGLSTTVHNSADLQSSAEINTVPTSFADRGPDWAGTSASEVTIGGIYDGSLGDDTLTFTYDIVTIIGVGISEDITVTDGDGQTIDTIDLDSYTQGDTITLSTGLEFTLGHGAMVDGDSFTVDVFASVPSAVNPDNPFDGTRNQDPNFDPGFSVTAGSFEINGETIVIDADDTINTVVGKINASAAGVTANFDAVNEIITLANDVIGGPADILLANDTSGFLAATKLDYNNVVYAQSTDSEAENVINTVSALSAISSGHIEINGVAISVDVAADSLMDVIGRINSSGANVTASLVSDNFLQIKSNTKGTGLELADNGTGFWAATLVPEGTFAPGASATTVSKGLSKSNAVFLVNRLENLAGRLSVLFSDQRLFETANADVVTARKMLQESIAGYFGQPGQSRINSGIGISFDFSSEGDVFTLSLTDRHKLVTILQNDPAALEEMLFGSTPESNDGLLTRLLDPIETVLSRSGQSGVRGVIDLLA